MFAPAFTSTPGRIAFIPIIYAILNVNISVTVSLIGNCFKSRSDFATIFYNRKLINAMIVHRINRYINRINYCRKPRSKTDGLLLLQYDKIR